MSAYFVLNEDNEPVEVDIFEWSDFDGFVVLVQYKISAHNYILIGDGGLLLLHSNEIADCVGSVEGIKILNS